MGCSHSTSELPDNSIPLTPISSLKFASNKNSTSMSGKDIGNSEGNLEMDKIRHLLKEYIETERKIQILEVNNPVTVFYVKKSQLDQIDINIEEKMKNIESLKQNLHFNSTNRSSKTRSGTRGTSNRRKFERSVHEVLINMGDKIFGQEEQEILASTNKLEIALTELEMHHQEKVLLGNDVAQLVTILSEMSEEYKKQDYILSELGLDENFQTATSDEESELVDLESARITISEIFERWREARNELLEASSQFSMVLVNIEESSKTPTIETPIVSTNGRGQYEIGEEIRDRLVSIWQALHNVQFLVGRDLPYCTDTELPILEKAMTYLFIDLRTHERRKHATNCYCAFQRRTLALLAWVEKTIEVVIQPILALKQEEVDEKTKLLSQLRVKNLYNKFPNLDWDKLHNIEKKTIFQNDLIQDIKNMEVFDIYSKLDAASRKIMFDFNYNYLAKLPDKTILIGGIRKLTSEQREKTVPPVQKIPNASERAKRVTRMASIDNLAYLLVEIDTNFSDDG